MDKIRVKSITVTRAEGTIEEVDRPQILSGEDAWNQADKLLLRWSETAPKDCHTYDKCDFFIKYEDDETYRGRYDLKHRTCEYPDLGKHVRDFVTFHAGKRKPVWMTEEQYESFFRQPHVQKMKLEFQRFLENYQIP